MNENLEVELKALGELFELLMNTKPLLKGPQWKGDWYGWDLGKTWHPEECGVYLLWETENCMSEGRRPVYIGEGYFGTRVHASFHGRKKWNFAQMLHGSQISNMNDETTSRRKALERLCILVLNPIENDGRKDCI